MNPMLSICGIHMKSIDVVGKMVEFAPGGEHHCVGIVLKAYPSMLHRRPGWVYKCLWDDGTIESINSEEVSFVERVK